MSKTNVLSVIKQICRLSCNLPFNTILVDVYYETTNAYCKRNGNSNSFSELVAAKANCSADDNCIGISDNCGEGKSFKLCNAPLSLVPSACGSVVYGK